MNSETRLRAREIFDEAVDLPDEARPALLERACDGDAPLRAEVERLLAADNRAGEFLGAPTVDPQGWPAAADNHVALGGAQHARAANWGLPSDGLGLPPNARDVQMIISAAAQAAPALAPTDRAAPHERAGCVIGPYKLLERIGEGGFGAVYLAEQKEPVRRRVAVKVIKLGMDTRQVIARFEAERQALAMMDHPHIARVLDAGATDTGRPYFVMELVKGVPITRYCGQNQVPLRQRLALFTDVCHAVQHAHQKGVIHRDLKPSNVLVSRHDDKPVVKVIDFGVAKATGGRLTDKTLYTEWRALIGTPAYMSPEQAGMSDLDVDTRSDIYALGVLLYELLTGTTPFDAHQLVSAGVEEMRRIICEVDPPKPSTRIEQTSKSATGGPAEAWRQGPSQADSPRHGVETSKSDGSTMPTSDYRPLDPGSSHQTIATARRPDHRALAKSLRGDLDWIVMKCLEKDRARRYETANALALDVGRYLSGEPVVAAPPGKLYRARKLVRKNRGLVSAATAVVLALSVGLGGAVWQAERARDEADKSRAISDFMQNTLAAANPFEEFFDPLARADSLGPVARDRKVIDVLDQAALDLDGGKFKDQPLTEAALRFSIGKVYDSLQQPDKSEKQLRRAYAIQGRQLGLKHPDTLATLVELAGQAGFVRAADADALMELARQIVPRVLGPEHRLTLWLREIYGELLRAAKFRDDLAIEELRQVLAIQQRVLAPEDPAVLRTMYNLAVALDNLEQWSEARELAQQALDRAARTHGEDDVFTHMARKGLVIVVSGPTEQHLSLIRTALDGLRRHLGPDHPQTLDSRALLAKVLIALGRLDEADQVARALIPDLQRVQGAGATDYARGLVAEILWQSALKLDGDARAGKLEEAEHFALDSLNILRSAPQGRDAGARGAEKPAEALYEIYRLQDRPVDALGVARKAVEGAAARPQAGDYGRIASTWRDHLIYMLTFLGQLDEAIAVAREEVDALSGRCGDTHAATLCAMNGLAWALCLNNQFAEAEPIAAEAVAGFRLLKTHVLDRINTTDTLAMILCKLNRPAEAEPLFREILELFARGTPPRFFPGDAGLHALHYGECLMMLQRYQEAEARLLEALNAASAAPGQEAKQTVQAARQRLVELYETLGMPEKAAEYRASDDAVPDADGQP